MKKILIGFSKDELILIGCSLEIAVSLYNFMKLDIRASELQEELKRLLMRMRR